MAFEPVADNPDGIGRLAVQTSVDVLVLGMSLRSSEVVAGSTMSAWPRGGRPPRLMHDDEFRRAARRRAAGWYPADDETDRRPPNRPAEYRAVGSLTSIEIVGLTRMQQTVGDARRRDGPAERVCQSIHRGRAKRQRRLRNTASGAIAETAPVVVHKRTVLVRASDAVDAEAAFLARGEEAEVYQKRAVSIRISAP